MFPLLAGLAVSNGSTVSHAEETDLRDYNAQSSPSAIPAPTSRKIVSPRRKTTSSACTATRKFVAESDYMQAVGKSSVLCSSFASPQVARALTIKSHYLQTQAKQLETQRKEAEQKATSGIMSLGLNPEGSSNSSSGSEPSSPSQ